MFSSKKRYSQTYIKEALKSEYYEDLHYLMET